MPKGWSAPEKCVELAKANPLRVSQLNSVPDTGNHHVRGI